MKTGSKLTQSNVLAILLDYLLKLPCYLAHVYAA